VITDNYRVDLATPYHPKQIVGVAVDRTEKKAWFSLDGNRAGEYIHLTAQLLQRSKATSDADRCLFISGPVLENVFGQLYPAVSFLQGPSRVKVNFGLKKENSVQFKYRLDGGLRTPISPTPSIRRRGTGWRDQLPPINTTDPNPEARYRAISRRTQDESRYR
jgi:hypothetical protein